MILETNRVAVIGLGGGGGRIVSELAADETLSKAVDLAVADTDVRTLQSLDRVVHIPLGRDWTRQSGCGGNATMGEKAAAASVEDLKQFVDGAAMVLVVAGLGGGTGSGAARVLARQLRQMNMMSLFMVSLPFSFEGNWRCHQAEKDLEALRRLTDAVLAIPNDLLFSSLPADTPATRAFEVSNTVLAEGLNGLACLTQADALLSVDFTAVRSLLKEQPTLCTLGVGNGSGPDRWQQVVRDFFACPLVGGPDNLAKADAAVLTLIGGAGLSVGEMQTCLAALQQQFPPTARLLVGAFADPRLQDEVQLTGLVCRFGSLAAEAAAELPGLAGAKPQTPATAARRPGKKTAATSREIQGELPLQEQSLGIFAGSTPTTVNGENLDIPTFQRGGIYLDLNGWSGDTPVTEPES